MDNFSSDKSLGRSLPEIHGLNYASDQKSGTCGRNSSTAVSRAAQLPLDKSNCRFLKQSVQSFLQQEGDCGTDELRRLELSVNILESYCNEIKSGAATSKESLDRLEKQIATIIQNAQILWNRKKKERGLSSTPSSPTLSGRPVQCDDVLISLCSLLDRCSKMLNNYCKFLGSTCTDNEEPTELRYSWGEPILDSSRSHSIQTEELFDTIQSRQFQVKFCHAGLAKKFNGSKTKTMSIKRHTIDRSDLSWSRSKWKWKSRRCVVIACVVVVLLLAGIITTVTLLVHK